MTAPPRSEAEAEAEDYRAVHLAKGAHYDSHLAEAPFDRYMATWERRHLPSIVRRLFPHGPKRHLDFACGTGRITETVAPLAEQSVGVDISPTMLQEARRKCPRTRFERVDLTSEDPDLGTFDLITSFRFFGNAQESLRDAVLRALVRRLAPGGHLVINSHRNPHALFVWTQRLTGGGTGGMDLHLPKLRRLLRRHGLRISALQPIGAWMYRDRLMTGTEPDGELARRNEARFGAPWLAAIAPDVIVVASRQ
ncbi:MAG: class I SAM-dependent methyltransferase [Burkholderiaceae bacterium]|nr:class I SAM-dependent methyltransferase [Burkholderiaceae bacterium]